MICSDRLDFQNLRFLLDIQRSIQPLQLSVCQLVDSPGTSKASFLRMGLFFYLLQYQLLTFPTMVSYTKKM